MKRGITLDHIAVIDDMRQHGYKTPEIAARLQISEKSVTRVRRVLIAADNSDLSVINSMIESGQVSENMALYIQNEYEIFAFGNQQAKEENVAAGIDPAAQPAENEGEQLEICYAPDALEAVEKRLQHLESTLAGVLSLLSCFGKTYKSFIDYLNNGAEPGERGNG